ncbi:GGDEF domain-containing protein [Frateuria terrea]|uniref:diguanylate cyclase n=1 Tax=Frateuria terrea TaxID=529704 RepID=A0A1H6Q2B8_9GAMM|nr:GGDEF domain-containing protein [Frateuria terrea]SEI37981.1 diguanylate cyclase (GGDEF) domain-containing protein [Frateuria terrea]SFP03531.1 diguanylate cyclase (GGDEF) domain-containing protein [Frateuria terrea]
MKANWLKDFGSSLDQVLDRFENVQEVLLHYRSGDAWVALSEGGKASASELEKSVAEEKPIKLGRTNSYLFPVAGADASVEIRLERFARGKTLGALSEAIDRIKEASQHKYDAHHDSLTGCKNRKSFEISAKKALERLGANAAGRSSAIGSSGVRSIALVTLDIDFFKRVNDTYGHDYGDVVLSAFSWHIEDAILELTKEAKRTSVEFFRLGGEEFNLLISGEFEDRELLDWIERVRLHVKSSAVPSESQLAKLGTQLSQTPPERERRVTASFGVSRYSVGKSSSMDPKVIERLKVQADKALYAAKNSGRDCVRFYPDILKRYGRILEHEKSVGIVVVDIGSEVGVAKGQEFFVIPPKFTGEVDYVVDDGRSRRKLGRYPKYKVARLLAFDVQPEISFCKVSEKLDNASIEIGSYLDLIPVGLFSGLVGQHGDEGVESEGSKNINRRVATHSTENFCVLAVQIRELDQLERHSGPGRVNDLLSSVSSIMTKALLRKAKPQYVEGGLFGAVLLTSSSESTEHIKALRRELEVVCEGLAVFAIGYVEKGKLEEAALPLENAWEYAVLAAAAAPSMGMEAFTLDLPLQVLENQDAAGQNEQLILDYERFKSLGISGAKYDNLAGIANFLLGKVVQADLAFKSAVDASPDENVYRLNLAYTRMQLEKFRDAYDQAALAEKLSGGPPDPMAMSIIAYSSYKLWKAGDHVLPRERIISLLRDASSQEENSYFSKDEMLQAEKEMISELALADSNKWDGD